MSNSLWKSLGFKENPYDTKPLKVNKSDVELLLGRDTEQIDFLTAIEADEQGVLIISGVPGVGKTSFLNVQQYLLESQKGGLDQSYYLQELYAQFSHLTNQKT